MRVRGRGAPRKDGSKGDLLVTVDVAGPGRARRRRPGGRRGLPRGPQGRRPACPPVRGRRVMPTRWTHGGQGRGSRVPGPTVPVYVISVAAELTGLHPQTLRQYDRVGPGLAGPHRRRRSPLLAARHRAAARGRRADRLRHRPRGRTPHPRARAPGGRPACPQQRAAWPGRRAAGRPRGHAGHPQGAAAQPAGPATSRDRCTPSATCADARSPSRPPAGTPCVLASQ